MSKSSSYKIITPPNLLSDKVRWNKADNIALLEKRAAQWMRVAEKDAKAQLIEDVALLDETVRRAVGAKTIPSDDLLEILRMANDIRTQAVSFEFDDLAAISSAVCEFVDRTPELAAARGDALVASVDAMKAVASHTDGGGTGSTDRALASASVEMLEIVTRA